MEPRIHPKRHAWGLALFAVALTALACQLALDWLAGRGYMLYVGIPFGSDHLRGLAQFVAVILFLTALAFLVPPLFNRIRHRRWRSAVRGLVIVALWVVSIGGLFALFLATVFTPVTYLHPFSHDDHRIVVAERTMLLLGSGAVYAHRGGPLYERVHAYPTDDGATPIEKDRYSIEWSGSTVTLTLEIEGRAQVERVRLSDH